MPEFLPGIELARAFYADVITSLVGDVPHAAALVGTGSDVLGFDTPRSTDHGWGPRLTVFVSARDIARVRAAIDQGLPAEFRGWPTQFGWDDVPVTHHVETVTLREWLLDRLRFDPRDGIGLRDWLGTPQQVLLEVTGGAVVRDDAGELRAVRDALAWYPDEVWLWILACQWRRIDQEEPFVGRAAEVGDELGSRIVAARLARDVVRLCFLLERRYAPYSKWLGTAFRQLNSYPVIAEPLLQTLAATDYASREDGLVRALAAAAALHNTCGVTGPVDEGSGQFHERPFRVLGASRFVDACLERVEDPRLRALPLVGGIDQLIDSADVLSEPVVLGKAARLYDLLLDSS